MVSRVRVLSEIDKLVPRFAMSTARRLLGKDIHRREAYRDANYQGVRTIHNAKPLHVGRFADVYDRWISLDPHTSGDWLRYRLYNDCIFAALCRDVPGDFICAGVSFGVAPRMIYDFAQLDGSDKTLHLIDPFEGVWSASSNGSVPFYNSDIEYVRRQYPMSARVQFHREFIPDAFPLPGVSSIAYATLNTGDEQSEAASIAPLFEKLSIGGAIVVGRYGAMDGHFDVYDSAFERLGIEPIWLPSGQCIIIKR